MKKQLISKFRYLYFFSAFTLLAVKPVHAYIDPSVMTYAIQAVAGIAIALGAAFSIVWRKIRRKLFKNSGSHYQTVESDDVTFTDPQDQTVFRAMDGITAVKPKTKAKASKKPRTPKELFLYFLKTFLPAFLLVCAFAYMIAVYGPLEMYMNNKTEFWFDFPVLRPELIVMFLRILKYGIPFYLLVYFLHKKFYDQILVIGLILFVSTYIQGNYLAGHMPPMDGTTVVWTDYAADMTQSKILLLAVMIVIVLLSRFLKKNFYLFVDFICIAVSVMLTVSLISISSANKGTAAKPDSMVVTMDGLFEFSNDQNLLIVVVDATDATYFREAMEKYPEYADTLDGFTFYPDTLGAHPFTLTSIPFILSGQWYEAQKPRTEFQTEALDASPLLKELEDRGFTMYAHDEGSLTYESKNAERFKNIRMVPKQTSYSWLLQNLLFKLTGYKYAPYFLKPYFQTDVEEFKATQKFVINGEIVDMEEHSGCDDLIYSWRDRCNYSYMRSDSSYSFTDDKVFHFYHLQGAHTPFNLNENLEVIDENIGTYEQKLAATCKVIDMYMRKLKKLGIYDNTAILVMGDHGYNVNKPGKIEGYGRQNPLLMVKGMNEHHDFAISEAPISYDDLQTAYARLLDGSSSEEAFDAKEGDIRERRFLYHSFAHMENLTEYILTYGTAADDNALEPTGRVYNYSK
ncbi:MAG: sulfatase-like hydrolase/transferase [Solobacterium sp.]|nr:sulfatase-like hydrolase/transferase [Solobacterium sp.]